MPRNKQAKNGLQLRFSKNGLVWFGEGWYGLVWFGMALLVQFGMGGMTGMDDWHG